MSPWRYTAGFPGWAQCCERELRVLEAERDEPVGSVKVGELPGGRPALHRPDLPLRGVDGRSVVVEVELSMKARRRLAGICRGYARARHVDHVYYLANSAAARAVLRAVQETRAQDRITVVGLDEVDRAAGLVGETGVCDAWV